MAKGAVYILQNVYYRSPNGLPLLKIGGTSRSAYDRALELSQHTGVPGDFDIEYEADAENWLEIEKRVHKRLDGFRVSKEFFACKLEDATQAIDEEVEKYNAFVGAVRKVEVILIDRPEEAKYHQICFRKIPNPHGDFFHSYYEGSLFGYVQVRRLDCPTFSYEIDKTKARKERYKNSIVFLADLKINPANERNYQRMAVRTGLRNATVIVQKIGPLMSGELSYRKIGDLEYEICLCGEPIYTLSESVRTEGLFKKTKVYSYRLHELPGAAYWSDWDKDRKPAWEFVGPVRYEGEDRRTHIEKSVFFHVWENLYNCIEGRAKVVNEELVATIETNTGVTAYPYLKELKRYL